MLDIAAVFLDPIVPVFAIMAVGFALGRLGTVSVEDARTINRFVMTLPVPIVVFGLLARADVGSFSPVPVALYLATEVIVFSAGFVLARRVFGRPPAEAVLIAFGSIFANNVFFTLPIALILYGPDGVLPITTIVTLDATVSFGAAMIALQVISLGKARPLAVARTLAATPILQAIALGAVVVAAGIALPAPLATFVDFNGAAAAPVALFALGVVLSQVPLRPDRLVLVFVAIKLVAMPALVALGLLLFAPHATEGQKFVLGAAGPAGAMSFSLAMLFGVPVGAILQLIIWSSLLSLATLAVLA